MRLYSYSSSAGEIVNAAAKRAGLVILHRTQVRDINADLSKFRPTIRGRGIPDKPEFSIPMQRSREAILSVKMAIRELGRTNSVSQTHPGNCRPQ